MAEPWETVEGGGVWKTRAQYFTWLRGQIRKIWSDYPVRKEWKKGQLTPVSPEQKLNKVFHPSTKNVGQCVYCLEWMAGSKLECDHRESSGGCRDYNDILEFLWYCCRGNGSMWQLVCKTCHKIKTYADAQGVTFEEAKIEKEAILICKEKRDKEWLQEHGITPESNKTKRRGQIIEHLKEIK